VHQRIPNGPVATGDRLRKLLRRELCQNFE
jgi:hypothetical protein